MSLWESLGINLFSFSHLYMRMLILCYLSFKYGAGCEDSILEGSEVADAL